MIFRLGGLLPRSGLEQKRLRIGYMPTLDAATLIIAQCRGFFAEEGLEVQLSRQTSWQRARQGLANRDLDAAHMPGTAPLSAHLGMDGLALPLRTAVVLALGGSSFGLHASVVDDLQPWLPSRGPITPQRTLAALARLVTQRREQGEPKLRFAVTDLSSTGSYDLRYCLAGAGIDPVLDVELVPITPGRVLKSLRGQHYDGAWLDEPYGSLAADEGLVRLMFSKHAFWNHSLAKVLAVPERLAKHYPRTHRALLRAVLCAAAWLEEHREEALELIAGRQGLDLEARYLQSLLSGIDTAAGRHPADIVFSASAGNFPWYSQAVWYLGQMIRWGDYAQALDFKKTAQAVFLPKHFREAARDLQLPYPSIGYKNEGEHAAEWLLEEASEPMLLGADLFYDQRIYKPRQTMKYLNGLEISHITAPLDAMWAIR